MLAILVEEDGSSTGRSWPSTDRATRATSSRCCRHRAGRRLLRASRASRNSCATRRARIGRAGSVCGARGPRHRDGAAQHAQLLSREAPLRGDRQLRASPGTMASLGHAPRQADRDTAQGNEQGLAGRRHKHHHRASIPCNAIPDEILTDHPDRFRAMIIESGNPVHSLADSPRMREALGALDFVGGDRRGDDRDRPARRLHPAGRVAVREGGGHLLRRRLPRPRLPAASP